MSEFWQWWATLSLYGALGVSGFLILRRCHVPAPALLGSLTFLAIPRILGWLDLPFYDVPLSFTAKILSGMVLGQKLNRETLKELSSLKKPVALASVWMVGASLCTGFLLFLVAGNKMTLLTSLIASAAAGISEMAIFALSVQAEVSLVVFFQAIRIVVAYVTIPFLVQALQRRYGHETLGSVSNPSALLSERAKQLSGPRALPAVAVAIGMAWLFVRLGVPAGAMLGAMTGTAVMNLVTGRVLPCPEWLRQGAQIGLSISISRHFSPQTLVLIVQLFWPLVFSTVFMQLCSLALAFVMQKITRWKAVTCVLATCPGGVSQVIFLAEDMDADPFVVGLFHTVRMISTIVLIPIAVRFLLL